MSKTKSSETAESRLAICAGCSLLCDDIAVNAGAFNTKGCAKGQSFFQIEPSVSRCQVDGKATDLDTAIVAATKILRSSKAPLVCGLDQLSMQSQTVAWKIAEQIGASVDTTLGNDGRASMFALQRIGKVTATLGEIASRSDLVVFWFCDPMTTHPRLLQRLGKRKRRIIVVDAAETATAKAADQFVQVDAKRASSVLAAISAGVGGIELQPEQLKRTPLSSDMIDSLAKSLKSANYGSIFFGQPHDHSEFDLSTDLVHSLIRRLNDVTRFVGQKLRNDWNAQSAEDVLAWSSGYPFAINYAKRLPRYSWLEHSTETILQRGECDSILLATGADLQSAFGSLSRTAKSHLESISKITFTPLKGFVGDVSFSVGVTGINEPGDWVRNDGLALPLPVTHNTDQSSNPAGGEIRATIVLKRILAGLSNS